MPKGDFINVDIKDARVKKAFGELIRREENFRPLTEEIANHLYNLTDEAFEVVNCRIGSLEYLRLKTCMFKHVNYSNK